MIGEISFKNKKYLYFPGFHIHKLFAEMAIQTSKPNTIPNLGNQPYFFTKSAGHDWLIDLFQVTNMLLRKAVTQLSFIKTSIVRKLYPCK